MRAGWRDVISRGVRCRCPNCGGKSMFAHGSLRIRDRCPRCGLLLNRGEGFFLGPMVVNYGIVAFMFVVPLIVLWANDILPGAWAAGLAVSACVILPFVLYRFSWSLWLSVYFWILPDRLCIEDKDPDASLGE